MFSYILLQWFRENGRALPWRETRDPYAVWLSEVILQQTRIKQGRDYWLRFVQRWPTVEALAAATEDEVLREWQGLGYYSRARNLHHAAQQIVALGRFPDTFDTLRKLKGVGDYTAAAIASIAFDEPVAVVDGNVYRVLSRHFGIATPINSTEGKHEFAALAQSLLPPKEASAYNQAIMDFGAIQCTPKSPRCVLCPLQESCDALHTGRIDMLPVKLKTLKVRERHLTYVYIRCKGQTAIHRRGAGDIWQGLWEPLLIDNGQLRIDNYDYFPGGIQTETPEPKRKTNHNSQFSILNSQLLKRGVRHQLTHQTLIADFYLLEATERPPLPDDYIWIDEKEFDRYAKPRLIELLLQSLP